jgi:hypothetical protein
MGVQIGFTGSESAWYQKSVLDETTIRKGIADLDHE